MWARRRGPRIPSTRWRAPPRTRHRAEKPNSFVASRARAGLVDHEHLGEAHAVVIADDDRFASGDEAPVDVDVERLAAHLVELEDRPRSEPQNIGDFHAAAPDLDRHLDR